MKDLILASSIKDEILEVFEKGLEMGPTTHYKELDKHMRLPLGNVLVMAGPGNLGKTTFVNQLLINKAVKDDWKIAVFSPESHPPTTWNLDLIHTKTGLSVQKKFNNHISTERLSEEIDWVNGRFLYVYPEVDRPTIKYIMERFEEAVKEYGVNVVVLDPFGVLIQEWAESFGRDDKFIEFFLFAAKRFALKHNVLFIVVVHPNSTIERNKDTGDFRMLDPLNLRGGIMWQSHSDILVVYHRPFFISNPSNPLCLIRTYKCKVQRTMGIPGCVGMYFDRRTNRFYELGEAEGDFLILKDGTRIPLNEVMPADGYCPLDEHPVQLTMEDAPF